MPILKNANIQHGRSSNKKIFLIKQIAFLRRNKQQTYLKNQRELATYAEKLADLKVAS